MVGHTDLSNSIGSWIVQLLAGALSVTTITALVKWFYSQQHRVVSVRASYLAQLESLNATIDREIAYVAGDTHPFSWFPILPFFESETKPLSLAGILSYNEVREITSAYIAYKETLTYLWQYGQPSKDSDVIGRAIGVNLDRIDVRGYYSADLELLKESVARSVAALRKAQKSRSVKLLRTVVLAAAGATLYVLGLISSYAGPMISFRV